MINDPYSSFKNMYLRMHIWLRWVFVAASGLPLAVMSGATFWFRCAGFSLKWLLLLQSMGSSVLAQ